MLHAGVFPDLFSALKMVICSTEMPLHIWTTGHCIPEDVNIYKYCCENLKFHVSMNNLSVGLAQNGRAAAVPR